MIMRLLERNISVPRTSGNHRLIEQIEHALSFHFNKGETPIRLAITGASDGKYECEVGCLVGVENSGPSSTSSIFSLQRRRLERTDIFTTVFLVPTGIGAEIGGHAGDATPAARLLSSCCDQLITHPNVVNASDINELPANAYYVEGSVICRLLMGTIGLSPVRNNRVLVVIDSRPDAMIENLTINTVEAARMTLGLNCVGIHKLEPPLELYANYSSSGRAAGVGHGIGRLIDLLDEMKDEYDAVAISSQIDVPDGFHDSYFESDGEMVNPWGGVEAMLTHAVSHLLNVPSAHAPMMESREILFSDPGRVDPRMAAEAISSSFFYCVLKGLLKSPRIVVEQSLIQSENVLSVEDVSCLVIPDGCIGLPTLAALEQGIPVIAVREGRGVVATDLSILPWSPDQLFIVENYWEAAGVMSAIRSGISPSTVRRPIEKMEVKTHSSSEPIRATYPSSDKLEQSGG